MKQIKTIDEADISDDLMFSWVMEQEDNCLGLIQAVLPELGITSIKFETQKRLAFSETHKASIPDILAFDDEGHVYDLEMQLTRQRSLGKRMRYYQSMIDQRVLLKGMPYDNLMTSYIIVFFPLDPFNENRKRYTFQYRCNESERVDLKSESTIIMLNSQGQKGEVSGRLQRFFNLMNGKIDIQDKYIHNLQKEIEKLRINPRRRKMFMDYQLKLQDAIYDAKKEGMKEGKVEGKKERMEEDIKKMSKSLKDNGMSEAIAWSIIQGAHKNDMSNEKLKIIFKENFR